MKKTILLGAIIGFTAVLAVSGADVKENWDKMCAKCHGADGKGETKMGAKLGVKDFTDPKVQAEMKDDAALKAVKEGIKKDDRTVMKAFSDLSDDEAKALVQYVRGLKK